MAESEQHGGLNSASSNEDISSEGEGLGFEGRRRPSMASPMPPDCYIVTDDDFEHLQKFDWSNTRQEILNDLAFVSKLPKTPALDYETLGPSLPPKSAGAPKRTLFLDLDETIAHTSLGEVRKNRAPDLIFSSESDGAIQANVYFRPWVEDFLRIVSHYYEIVLFTASLQPYADLIIDELDVEARISHRLYREHCTQYGASEIFFKDLHGTGRDLALSVVVDNRMISFGLNVENGIFVSSFTGQEEDTELLHLLPMLIALAKSKDVRRSLTQTYRLPEIVAQYQHDHDIHPDSPTPLESPLRNFPELAASIQAIGSLNSLYKTGSDKVNIHSIAAEVIGRKSSTLPAIAQGEEELEEFDAMGVNDPRLKPLITSASKPATADERISEPSVDDVISLNLSSPDEQGTAAENSVERLCDVNTPSRSGSRHLNALARLSHHACSDEKEGGTWTRNSSRDSSNSTKCVSLPFPSPRRFRPARRLLLSSHRSKTPQVAISRDVPSYGKRSSSNLRLTSQSQVTTPTSATSVPCVTRIPPFTAREGLGAQPETSRFFPPSSALPRSPFAARSPSGAATCLSARQPLSPSPPRPCVFTVPSIVQSSLSPGRFSSIKRLSAGGDPFLPSPMGVRLNAAPAPACYLPLPIWDRR